MPVRVLPLELYGEIFEYVFQWGSERNTHTFLLIAKFLYPCLQRIFLRDVWQPLIALAFALPRTHWVSNGNQQTKFLERFFFVDAGPLPQEALTRLKNMGHCIRMLHLHFASQYPETIKAVLWIQCQIELSDKKRRCFRPSHLEITINEQEGVLLRCCDFSDITYMFIFPDYPKDQIEPFHYRLLKELIPYRNLQELYILDMRSRLPMWLPPCNLTKCTALTNLTLAPLRVLDVSWDIIAVLPSLYTLHIKEMGGRSRYPVIFPREPSVLNVVQLAIHAGNWAIQVLLQRFVRFPLVEDVMLHLGKQPGDQGTFNAVRERILSCDHLRCLKVDVNDTLGHSVDHILGEPNTELELGAGLRELQVHECVIANPMSGAGVDRLQSRLLRAIVKCDNVNAFQGCIHLPRTHAPYRLFLSLSDIPPPNHDHQSLDVWVVRYPPSIRYFWRLGWHGMDGATLSTDYGDAILTLDDQELRWVIMRDTNGTGIVPDSFGVAVEDVIEKALRERVSYMSNP